MNDFLLNMAAISVSSSMELPVKPEIISDNAVVEIVLNGNSRSYKTIVDRYQRSAYIFARGMVGNQDDALDLSQEAFVRAYRNLPRFNPIYPFRVWFYKILSNLCKNHLRQRKNREAVITSTEMTSSAVSSSKTRPDISFEKSQTQQIVWECISQLPEKFREIIILSHFQELSYDQIASVLDIPHGSVMSRLYYARKKLKEHLESKGVCL